MKDLLYVAAGVAVFAATMFGFLVLSMRGAYARVHFEKVKRELEKQGRYEEWASVNRKYLVAKAVASTIAWSGLPAFLLFHWLGYRQISLVFLGIFVISLVALVPINRILRKRIQQDL